MKKMYWKTSQNRKVHQRALNTLMRKINKNVENDLMWKGRYCMRQYRYWWLPYWEEPDYYVFYAQFIFYDKKTHKTHLTDIKSANDWSFGHGYKLWREMNDFILDSGVWEEEPKPTYENTPDFRSIII